MTPTDADTRPRVFSIAAGTPFLATLARALLRDATLGGRLQSATSFDLADVTILLPTRRATRELAEAFLRESGGTALMLPTIRPLGDLDEEDLVLEQGPAEPGGAALLDLAPAISPLERQLLLARLIRQAWTDMDLARALALADELGRLLDQVATEEASLEGLASLVPESFAANWQVTVDFLRIVTEHWPGVLAERGQTDLGARRIDLLKAQAEIWRTTPPQGPVIAAGSTGSIPASAELMRVIAEMPHGAVVLPGLDFHLDTESFAALPPAHPQYGLAKLLTRLGLSRAEVEPWPDATPDEGGLEARRRMMSEVMRPAETTDLWQSQLPPLAAIADRAFDGLHLIEAANERAEASAIALALREAMEEPERTAALVTPDRGLARRVAAELGRWGLDVDDSAGRPVGATQPGTFFRLIADAAAEGFAPVPLLALLKHPLTTLGAEPGARHADIMALERHLLRGLRPAPGIDGLRTSLEERVDADDKRLPVLRRLIDDLANATAPITAALDCEPLSLGTVLRAHIETAERLAAIDGDAASGAARVWQGEAGEALAQRLTDLLTACEEMTGLTIDSYPHLVTECLAGVVVRPRFGSHPRLAILGPLEARLLHTDLLVLGGLNEGSWPQEAAIDPWLNRPMRQAVGLEAPERRIGLSAHDFTQSACQRRVLLTRAVKAGGSPTVASRWLLRLKNTALALGKDRALTDTPYLAWTDDLDQPDTIAPAPAPCPRPPVEARPTRLSVTEIETLMRDPYAVYARRVLKISPLDPIDADLGGAERGNLVHDALERFARAYPSTLPDDPTSELLKIGEEVFAPYMDAPGVAAIWWPRFLDIVDFMVDWEERRRPDIDTLHVEVKGRQLFEKPDPAVELTARADRIERRTDGTLAIIDYKTGRVPTSKEVKADLAPQLPLEAAIAARGGFDGVVAAPARQLLYVQLKGGAKGNSEADISEGGDATEMGENALHRLDTLLQAYQNQESAYLSRPRPQFVRYAGEYDHLARVKEWSAAGEGGEE